MIKQTDYLDLNERIRTTLRLGESHFREFKSAIHREPEGPSPREVTGLCRDIGETLVAFANADGGELIVGAEDNGYVTGIPHSEEQVAKMVQAPKTHVFKDTPLASPRVHDIRLYGQRILYFAVAKSTEFIHLTSDGRCLQRYDRENRPAAVERIQHERQERRSREYDREFVDGASAADLDLERLSLIGSRLMPGVSPEKLLQYLDLAEYVPGGLRLRRAAVLLFAKDVTRWHPRAEVRVVRVAGITLGVGKEYRVARDEVVRGNIFTLLTSVWETLRPHLAATRLGAGGLFQESLLYPEEACVEALVNAIAHRDYANEGRPIEIFIFDDRMEVQSPGGLVSTITVDQLRKLTRSHESRNAYVARALRESGYMRELGEGIPRIFRAMEQRDLVPPHIVSTSDTFKITLHHQSVFSTKDAQWLESYKGFSLSRDEQRVLLLAKDGHPVTPREIRTTLNIIDTEDYRKIVERLQSKGLIYSLIASQEVTLVAKRLGKDRMDVGRFIVRPMDELQRSLEELVAALREITPTSELSGSDLSHIQHRLSYKNPYRGGRGLADLIKSLRYLGFIDLQRRPLAPLNSLWTAPSQRSK